MATNDSRAFKRLETHALATWEGNLALDKLLGFALATIILEGLGFLMLSFFGMILPLWTAFSDVPESLGWFFWPAVLLLVLGFGFLTAPFLGAAIFLLEPLFFDFEIGTDGIYRRIRLFPQAHRLAVRSDAIEEVIGQKSFLGSFRGEHKAGILHIVLVESETALGRKNKTLSLGVSDLEGASQLVLQIVPKKTSTETRKAEFGTLGGNADIEAQNGGSTDQPGEEKNREIA